MTLDKLANYHMLRYRQVQYLQLAQEYHQRQLPEEQVLHALLMWADVMQQADMLWSSIAKSDAFWKAKGKA